MNMMNERVLAVCLVIGKQRLPARLYVRFGQNGVGAYLRLEYSLVDEPQRVEEVTTPTGGFLEALASGVLPRLPDGSRLELNHCVEMVTGDDGRYLVMVQEAIAAQQSDAVPTAAFRLSFTLLNIQYEFSDPEDIYYVFTAMAKREKLYSRICGFCIHAKITSTGGDDLRHGLFCFRDQPGLYPELKKDPDRLLWASQVWSNVDAFHFCPQFALAEHYKACISGQ